jgi:hypothetical protein
MKLLVTNWCGQEEVRLIGLLLSVNRRPCYHHVVIKITDKITHLHV